MKLSESKIVVVLLLLAIAVIMVMKEKGESKVAALTQPRITVIGGDTGSLPELAKQRIRTRKHNYRSTPNTSGSRALELGRIRNEVVVRLPQDVNMDDLKNLLETPIEVVDRIDGLNAYRLKFSSEAEAAEAKAKLEANPQFGTVEDNYRLARPVMAQTSDGTPVIQQNSLKLGDADGKLIVGLVDTAVQVAGSGMEGYLLPSISIADNAMVNASELQHGTAMASAILQGMNMIMEDGSTTSARILPVDVYGDSETTTTYQVAQGVWAALEAGATVINLSLGSDTSSPLLEGIIQQATEQGVVFLAAAGNTSTASPTYPAAYEEVIAVTSTDYTGHIAAYANYGDFVDIGTPSSIVVDFDDTKQVVTGTSVSTALATGIAVGLAEIKKSPVNQVEAKIRQVLAVH